MTFISRHHDRAHMVVPRWFPSEIGPLLVASLRLRFTWLKFEIIYSVLFSDRNCKAAVVTNWVPTAQNFEKLRNLKTVDLLFINMHQKQKTSVSWSEHTCCVLFWIFVTHEPKRGVPCRDHKHTLLCDDTYSFSYHSLQCRILSDGRYAAT